MQDDKTHPFIRNTNSSMASIKVKMKTANKRLLGPLNVKSKGTLRPVSPLSPNIRGLRAPPSALTAVMSLDRADYDLPHDEEDFYSNGRLVSPITSNHAVMHLREYTSSLNPGPIRQQVVMVNRDTDSVEVMLTEDLKEDANEPGRITSSAKSSVSSLSAGSLSDGDSEMMGFSVIDSYSESSAEPELGVAASDTSSDLTEALSEKKVRTVSPPPQTLDENSDVISEASEDSHQNHKWINYMQMENHYRNDNSIDMSDIPIGLSSTESHKFPKPHNLNSATEQGDEKELENPLAYARKMRALKSPTLANQSKHDFEPKSSQPSEPSDSSRRSQSRTNWKYDRKKRNTLFNPPQKSINSNNSSMCLNISTSSRSLNSSSCRSLDNSNTTTKTTPSPWKSRVRDNKASNVTDKSYSTSSTTGNALLMDRLSRAIKFGEVLSKKEEDKQRLIQMEIENKEKRLSDENRKRLDEWQSKTSFEQKVNRTSKDNSTPSKEKSIPRSSTPTRSITPTPTKSFTAPDTENSGFIPLKPQKNEIYQQNPSNKMLTPPTRTSSLQRALMRSKLSTNNQSGNYVAEFPSDEKKSKISSFTRFKPPPRQNKPIRPVSSALGKSGNNKRAIPISPARSRKSLNHQSPKKTDDTKDHNKSDHKSLTQDTDKVNCDNPPRKNTKIQRTHLGEITNNNQNTQSDSKSQVKNIVVLKPPKQQQQQQQQSILSLQMLNAQHSKNPLSSGSSVYSELSNYSKFTQYSRESFTKEERNASLNRKQNRVNQIHHSLNCKVTGLFDPETKTDICRAVPHCNAVSRLVQHVRLCKLSGEQCEVPSCLEFKRAYKHYERCRSGPLQKLSSCILCKDTYTDD